jgi:hypothetical protein
MLTLSKSRPASIFWDELSKNTSLKAGFFTVYHPVFLLVFSIENRGQYFFWVLVVDLVHGSHL